MALKLTPALKKPTTMWHFISSEELEERRKKTPTTQATLQISKISNLLVALGMFLLILVCCHSV